MNDVENGVGPCPGAFDFSPPPPYGQNLCYWPPADTTGSYHRPPVDHPPPNHAPEPGTLVLVLLALVLARRFRPARASHGRVK